MYTAGTVFALLAADSGLVPGIPYSHVSTTRRNSWVLPGVAQKYQEQQQQQNYSVAYFRIILFVSLLNKGGVKEFSQNNSKEDDLYNM